MKGEGEAGGGDAVSGEDGGDRDGVGRRGPGDGEAGGGEPGRHGPGSARAREAHPTLEALRDRILEVDDELVRLVGERRDLVVEIGRRKASEGLPVMDPAREAQVVRRAASLAREAGVDEEMVRDVIWRIIAGARQAQEGRTTWGPPETPLSEDEGSSPEDEASKRRRGSSPPPEELEGDGGGGAD